jgi:hypothetical protein
MMSKFEDISNSDLSKLIDEWIKSDRDRKILKRRFIDCIAYEPLAEEFDMSVRQIKRICYKQGDIVLARIPKADKEIIFGEEWAIL